MSKFLKRIGKRIVAGLVMILAVSSFTFFLVHFMPGNPVQTKLNTLIEEGIPPLQAQAQVRSMYGFIPHQPLYIQYLHYVWQVLHLNLGKSISYSGVPVMHLLLKAMPWTVIMVLTGLAVSFIIGISAGENPNRPPKIPIVLIPHLTDIDPASVRSPS